MNNTANEPCYHVVQLSWIQLTEESNARIRVKEEERGSVPFNGGAFHGSGSPIDSKYCLYYVLYGIVFVLRLCLAN